MHSPVARSMKPLLAAAMALALSYLAGCSSDGTKAVEPNPLPSFKEEVKVKEVWSRGVGNGQGGSWLHLSPAVEGDRIYVASHSGKVAALNRETGKVIWDQALERRITGATGIGGGKVLLGTRDGHVLALNQASGEVLWDAPVSSEVLSAPQISQGIVIAQTIDSRVFGLDAATGKKVWEQDAIKPVLTLRGTSRPLIHEGVVYAAFASGETRAYRLRDGSMVWSARVAVPKGSSELERMVDIDAAPLMVGGMLHLVSYQGNIARIDPASGRVLWSREASSFESMTDGFGQLYLATDESAVSAVDQRTGSAIWTQKKLEHRKLSAPATINSYVASVDFDGYLHLMSQVDGHLAGRYRVDSSGSRAQMVVVENMIYVYSNDGDLVALKLQ